MLIYTDGLKGSKKINFYIISFLIKSNVKGQLLNEVNRKQRIILLMNITEMQKIERANDFIE